MRRVTRNAVLVLIVAVLALLALGALPSFLSTGDPYYLTAEETNGSALTPNATAVDATNLSALRYPYATEALANGTSEGYRRGPWGIKETFTHSPFDEIDALQRRNASAVVGDGVVVSDNGTLYRLAVRQRP
mgnify:CR=1 FL=1